MLPLLSVVRGCSLVDTDHHAADARSRLALVEEENQRLNAQLATIQSSADNNHKELASVREENALLLVGCFFIYSVC